MPGEFFDVNPGKRRSRRASRFRRHVRFSFGPALDNLETALGRLETLAREAVTQTLAMFGSGVFAAPVNPGSPKPAKLVMPTASQTLSKIRSWRSVDLM